MSAPVVVRLLADLYRPGADQPIRAGQALSATAEEARALIASRLAEAWPAEAPAGDAAQQHEAPGGAAPA